LSNYHSFCIETHPNNFCAKLNIDLA